MGALVWFIGDFVQWVGDFVQWIDDFSWHVFAACSRYTTTTNIDRWKGLCHYGRTITAAIFCRFWPGGAISVGELLRHDSTCLAVFASVWLPVSFPYSSRCEAELGGQQAEEQKRAIESSLSVLRSEEEEARLSLQRVKEELQRDKQQLHKLKSEQKKREKQALKWDSVCIRMCMWCSCTVYGAKVSADQNVSLLQGTALVCIIIPLKQFILSYFSMYVRTY